MIIDVRCTNCGEEYEMDLQNIPYEKDGTIHYHAISETLVCPKCGSVKATARVKADHVNWTGSHGTNE